MDAELREQVPRRPERVLQEQENGNNQPPDSAADVRRNQTPEGTLAQRKQAAERAARSTREAKDPLLVRIESILSEGLSDEYATLSDRKKQELRSEGEALSVWLQGAIAGGKVRANQVLKRIERWLLIIEAKDRSSPWLLQEAYIRARRVLQEYMYEEKSN